MTLCPFHLFSGIPCPGCGFLHALWSLGQGDIARSLSLFPVWPVVGLAFVERMKRPFVQVGLIAVMGQWIFKLLG